MKAEFERREEFNVAEYAAIGQFLVAVTGLDDVIGRASMKLCSTYFVSIPEETLDKKRTKIVESSGKSRFNILIRLVADHCQNVEWFVAMKEEIDNLLEWRNAICHGRYSRGTCGLIRVEFFDKVSVRNMRTHPENCFSKDDLEALSALANKFHYTIHVRLLSDQ